MEVGESKCKEGESGKILVDLPPPAPKQQPNDPVKETPGSDFRTRGNRHETGSPEKDDGHNGMIQEKSHDHCTLSEGAI